LFSARRHRIARTNTSSPPPHLPPLQCLDEANAYKACRQAEKKELLSITMREQREEFVKSLEVAAEKKLRDMEETAEGVLERAKRKTLQAKQGIQKAVGAAEGQDKDKERR